MSGRRSKAIRRQVYGDQSLRARKYSGLRRKGDPGGKIIMVLADEVRRGYQRAKRAAKARPESSPKPVAAFVVRHRWRMRRAA